MNAAFHPRVRRDVPRSAGNRGAIVGEWLSLVEHLVRDQGVGGSNPLSPTNLFNNFQQEATLDSCLGTHSLSADLGRSALGCGFLCVLAMAAEAASTARVTASTRSYHQLLPQAFWITSILAWPKLSL